MFVRNPARPAIGKWNFCFYVNKDFLRMESYSREVTIMLFKPIKQPTPGTQFKKGEYQGFITSFRFWFPITVDRWK